MSTLLKEDLDSALAAARPHGWVLEPQAKHLLKCAGIQVPRFAWAQSRTAAEQHAAAIGYPVVVKIVSPKVIHKSDVGGVVVGISDAAQLLATYDRFSRMDGFKGILIEELVHGFELIVGAVNDHQFGPVIMMGIGGTGVEIYQDTALRMAPITQKDVHSMLNSLKGKRLLEGFRGAEPLNIHRLVHLMLTFSDVVMRLENNMSSIDLNPVMCTSQQCIVGDARIMIAETA